MPRQIQRQTIEALLEKVAGAIAIEGIVNPTPEQQKQIFDAKVDVSKAILGGNIMTAGQELDSSIATKHITDRILADGGIDRVELERAGAIAGAHAIVEQVGQLDNVQQPPVQIDAPAVDNDEIPL